MTATPTLSEAGHYLKVTTPLGADAVVLAHFFGEERVSSPFHFTLELKSHDPAIDFTALIGQGATVGIALDAETTRHVHGLVTRMVQAGTVGEVTTYFAELRPWLWMLTLTRDCRIFQQQTVPEILEALFTELGFTDFRNDCTGSYTARDYVVQYDESAFDFVHRLMEDVGIFYWFDHAEGAHTLVLADDASAWPAVTGATTVKVMKGAGPGVPIDGVEECAVEMRVATGKYAVDDYNFENATADLMSSVDGTAGGTLRVYEYQAGFGTTSDGETIATRRIEAIEAQVKTLRGRSVARGFAAGHKFTLAEHARADANAEWALVGVSHSARPEWYANTFEAIPAATSFRPERRTRRPRIPGTQTALVVGKAGEEIWTDQYGRVKVQFHWDQLGQKDENSSCWVRVAQGWAGKGWGAMFLPRIGQEVVVSFLDGDPDRPLVTGCVYNATMTVPYALPDNQTQSGVKTRSTKEGAADTFNEIRLEDKKDAEEIFVQAQKDMNVKVKHARAVTIDGTDADGADNEALTVTNGNRVTTITKGNDTHTLTEGNRVVTLTKGNDDLTLTEGNRTVTLSQGNESLSIADGTRTIAVSKDETHTVDGKRELTITGDEKHSNGAKFDHDTGGNYTLKVTGDLTIEATGKIVFKATGDLEAEGMNVSLKGQTAFKAEGAQFEIKGSGQGTVDGGGALTLKGGAVKIN